MDRFGSYNGFFILTCSALLFLGFKQLSFKSWAVNYIAASSFAVYLMHMHPLMRPVYSSICRYLFENYGTFEYICLISMFIVGVFFAAVAIDLLRRWLWNKIAETDSFKSTCTKLTYLTRG